MEIANIKSRSPMPRRPGQMQSGVQWKIEPAQPTEQKEVLPLVAVNEHHTCRIIQVNKTVEGIFYGLIGVAGLACSLFLASLHSMPAGLLGLILTVLVCKGKGGTVWQCSECRTTIEPKANRCPGCHGYFPAKSRKQTLLTISVSIAQIALVLVSFMHLLSHDMVPAGLYVVAAAILSFVKMD